MIARHITLAVVGLALIQVHGYAQQREERTIDVWAVYTWKNAAAKQRGDQPELGPVRDNEPDAVQAGEELVRQKRAFAFKVKKERRPLSNRPKYNRSPQEPVSDNPGGVGGTIIQPTPGNLRPKDYAVWLEEWKNGRFVEVPGWRAEFDDEASLWLTYDRYQADLIKRGLPSRYQLNWQKRGELDSRQKGRLEAQRRQEEAQRQQVVREEATPYKDPRTKPKASGPYYVETFTPLNTAPNYRYKAGPFDTYEEAQTFATETDRNNNLSAREKAMFRWKPSKVVGGS